MTYAQRRRAGRQDQAVDQKPANSKGRVEYTTVHEEFAQIATDVADFGGIRRAEVKENDALFRHDLREVFWGGFVKLKYIIESRKSD